MDVNTTDSMPKNTARKDTTAVDRNSSRPIITIDGLSKIYGSDGGKVEAVSDLDLEIERGDVMGLLGPNGAGKTTTIKCLLGLITPTTGTLRIADTTVGENQRALYRQVGAMLEGARNVYWRLTVRENLRFFSAISGLDPNNHSAKHSELLERFDLAEKEDTVVRELSRGQKQKTSLVCTLAREAPLLFLDEPTLGLDVASSLELRRELRRLADDQQTTIILSSHDMDVIEDICDRVVIMNNGQLVADDTVDGLLDVFETTRYEIVVSGDVSQACRRRLRREFGAEEFHGRDHRTRFRASVTGDEFYELVDTLRRENLSVISFDTDDNALEEAFLRVTEQGEHSRTVKPDTNI